MSWSESFWIGLVRRGKNLIFRPCRTCRKGTLKIFGTYSAQSIRVGKGIRHIGFDGVRTKTGRTRIEKHESVSKFTKKKFIITTALQNGTKTRR